MYGFIKIIKVKYNQITSQRKKQNKSNKYFETVCDDQRD